MAKGSKTGGGSRKGRPNKATAAREAEIAASGLTPLEYMLKVLRNKKEDKDRRLDAAKAAAPYVHPKLSSIVHKGDAKQPVAVATMGAKRFAEIARQIADEV
jgi:hypothetical protein